MTGEAMSQRRDSAESGLLLKDIGNMIITYLIRLMQPWLPKRERH